MANDDRTGWYSYDATGDGQGHPRYGAPTDARGAGMAGAQRQAPASTSARRPLGLAKGPAATGGATGRTGRWNGKAIVVFLVVMGAAILLLVKGSGFIAGDATVGFAGVMRTAVLGCLVALGCSVAAFLFGRRAMRTVRSTGWARGAFGPLMATLLFALLACIGVVGGSNALLDMAEASPVTVTATYGHDGYDEDDDGYRTYYAYITLPDDGDMSLYEGTAAYQLLADKGIKPGDSFRLTMYPRTRTLVSVTPIGK